MNDSIWGSTTFVAKANAIHSTFGSSLALSACIDDFGDVVTLQSWQAIIARMDFILSEGE